MCLCSPYALPKTLQWRVSSVKSVQMMFIMKNSSRATETAVRHTRQNVGECAIICCVKSVNLSAFDGDRCTSQSVTTGCRQRTRAQWIIEDKRLEKQKRNERQNRVSVSWRTLERFKLKLIQLGERRTYKTVSYSSYCRTECFQREERSRL